MSSCHIRSSQARRGTYSKARQSIPLEGLFPHTALDGDRCCETAAFAAPSSTASAPEPRGTMYVPPTNGSASPRVTLRRATSRSSSHHHAVSSSSDFPVGDIRKPWPPTPLWLPSHQGIPTESQHVLRASASDCGSGDAVQCCPMELRVMIQMTRLNRYVYEVLYSSGVPKRAVQAS